jgi:hypothetical protein
VPEQEYQMFLTFHRDLIRNGLNKHASNPRVFSKYVWLRDYHERTLRERFGAAIPSELNV